MFKMRYLDREFSTQYMIDTNPFKDYVMVDGFIVPMSTLPEELQEAAKKARREGGDIEFTTT
jgi:hypothetical protein